MVTLYGNEMRIISTYGIRHNVYQPDPEKHIGSQQSCPRNFQGEKTKQDKNYYALGYSN